MYMVFILFFFFFQAEDGIRDVAVTGVQTCALPIWRRIPGWRAYPFISSRSLMVTRIGEIVLAGPRGFCAGVERAIDIVEQALEVCGPPVYVRREIVHNGYVVDKLRAKGAIFVDELHEVPDSATVIFSAHGVSPAVREESTRRGLRVIDATCPLVTKVHLEAIRYAREGFSIVLIGHEDHDEDDGVSLARVADGLRSEEHTSELQSRLHLVCRLLLEKKKKSNNKYHQN